MFPMLPSSLPGPSLKPSSPEQLIHHSCHEESSRLERELEMEPLKRILWAKGNPYYPTPHLAK